MEKEFILGKYKDFTVRNSLEYNEMAKHRCMTCGKIFYTRIASEYAYKARSQKYRSARGDFMWFCSFSCYKAFRKWENNPEYIIPEEEWKKSNLVGSQTKQDKKCSKNHDELWRAVEDFAKDNGIMPWQILEKLYKVGAVACWNDWDTFMTEIVSDYQNCIDFIVKNYNNAEIRTIDRSKNNKGNKKVTV